MLVRKLILLFFISVVVFFIGCSSGKRSELSPIGKVYHNTTARYNGYYYGRLKLNKVLTTMNSSLEDDYTQLLPLFKNEQSATGPSSDLDSVVTKLTVVTRLHPKSKWTPDCYFLIGQAYYYKKDYESAMATFQFVVATYKEHTQTGKKKKQKSGPQKHTPKKKIDDVLIPWPDNDKLINLKHKPIRNEAMLWLLKTLIQLKKYDEAKSVLTYLNTDLKFPYNLRSEQELIATHLFLVQEKYKEAIEPLRIAIVLTKNKKLKTRYTYILAQLYQMTGSSDKAIETYKKVLTIKPNYKMEFYAQINIANSYSANGKSSSAEILDLLEKMARNEKYDEFRDQIYYAIAVVYLKQGNKQAAVKNLRLSIDNSSPLNANQKGLSYLKLGELDFDDQHYVPARHNYDSAVSFINKTVTNYSDVKKRANILDRLVDNMNTIELQDSLQKIAGMTEKQRNNFLDDVIRKAAEKKTEDSLRNVASAINSKAQAGVDDRGWYFYNAATKGTGFNEFKKKWGNRANEDNWRRSNKKSDANTTEEETNTTASATTEKKPSGKMTRESLLKEIPLTSAKIEESDKKIAEAYYGIGTIYSDELKDNPKAIDAYEKLLSRFPTSSYSLPAMYALYILYTKTGDASRADSYKSMILSKYPDSNFAKAITNPGFLEDNKKKESAVNDYYKATYSLYEQKNYPEVISRSKQSSTLYNPNPIAAKFDLLAAFAIAETQPKDSFKVALNKIVKTYSSGEEQQKAKDILALIEKRSPKPKTAAPDTSGPKTPYKFNPGNAQFLVIFFSKMEPGINSVIDSLSNYNKKNYSLKNYSIGQPTLTLDKKKEMIIIKEMKNSTEGLAYYNDIMTHGGFFENAENSDHDIFLIDDKNWPLFFKSPNVKEYVKFFIKNYGIKTEIMDDK